MSQLTESTAEALPTSQAAGLARVIDLQARWENLRDSAGKPPSDYTAPDLHGRQKAYEAFRAARADYTSKFRPIEVPETSLNTAERVAAWSRSVRAVFRRAEGGECPAAAVEKAYRLADKIASRLKQQPVERGPLATMADAVAALDEVVQWCDAQAAPAPIAAVA